MILRDLWNQVEKDCRSNDETTSVGFILRKKLSEICGINMKPKKTIWTDGFITVSRAVNS